MWSNLPFPSRTKNTTVFISSDDDLSVVKTVDILRGKVQGLDFKEFTDKGHFTLNNLGGEEFPELLKAVTDD